jgi:DNA-directed RNA polymerase I subunit RPA1
LTPEGNGWRKDIFAKGKNWGTEGAIENFPSLKDTSKKEISGALSSLLREVLRDDNKMARLDMTVKTKLAKGTYVLLPVRLAALPRLALRY